MFLPRVCIERPVLATVFSLALVAFGIAGYGRLPVRELPNIEFPIVSVTTVLPGASPEVVETEITEPLEEELNGIEGVEFIRSVSTEQVSSITIQFALDRNIDAASQDVRDRVGRVRNRLPEDAEEPRIRKIDADAQAIMWIALYSDTRHPYELVDAADRIVKPRLETVSGVGQILVGGSNRRALRVELDREALSAYGLVLPEVLEALRTENVEVPSGRVEGSWREFVVKTEGEFASPEEFAGLIVAYREGHPVRLGDLGLVRHGYENERTGARYKGVSTTGLGVVKQSGANTLEVARGIKRAVAELGDELPEGFELQVAFDQSGFIERSVAEVQQALVLAAVLVAIVIFVFLQSGRTTMIPSIVMPVAIVSTFGVMYGLGFTINNLTLMALTLVVGVVVDDAIIVLENIYRHMERGQERRAAALEASGEIAFAVISTTLTLVAVFVPIAFLSGIVGRFFFEFGISVAAAVCVSSFVALTLTPMLCSRFLVVGSSSRRSGALGSVARAFDRTLGNLTALYLRALRWSLAHRIQVVVVLVASLVVSGILFTTVGKEFVPTDDRGYFIARIKTPEGSTLAYHDRHQRQLEAIYARTPEIRSYFSILAPGGGGPGKVNFGIMFVRLVDVDRRDKTTQEVVALMRREAASIVGADAYFSIVNPLASGSRGKPVQFVIQNPDFTTLADYSERVQTVAREIPGFADVDTDLEVNKPQLTVNIDRDRAASLGISAADIADTLRVLLGGDAATRFKRGNERYDVIVQLAAQDRFAPQDLAPIYLRSSSGELVPMASVVRVVETVGPSAVNHYDRKRSVIIDANLDGIDLGSALARLGEAAAAVLPEDFTTTLAGESREFRRGSQGLSATFLLALIAIYLVLAAQFESFVHPLTIMLALPLATLGALSGLLLFGMTLNVYSFIGVIMLMGLVTKNSILLVDFINLAKARGAATRDAILEAGQTRLRPILMTAISTIFGILPIALGLGAGSESRRPLGVAVVAGMTASTLLTLLVVPVVYSMIDDARAWIARRRSERAGAISETPRPARSDPTRADARRSKP